VPPKRLLDVLDRERPGADLRGDVEELCDDPKPVAGIAEQPPNHRAAALPPLRACGRELVLDLRGLLYRDGDPDQQQQDRQPDVRHHDRLQFPGLDGSQLFRSQGGAVDGSMQLRQDERGSQEDPDIGADRVERLGQVKSPCGVTFRAHGDDEGVRRGLQDRQPCRQREERRQEGEVGHDPAGRVERERSQRGQAESGEDADLVAEPLVDERRRKREREIGAEVRELHQRGLERGHREDPLEGRHQWGGHIRRDSPCGEAENQSDE
jgi:hypothetical protein